MQSRILLTLFACLLSISGLKAQVFADQVVEAGPCDPIIPLLCASGVDNPQDAVDTNANSFALMRTDLGIASTAFLELGFSEPGTAGQEVNVIFQENNNTLNVDVIQSLTFTVFDTEGNEVNSLNDVQIQDIKLLSGEGGLAQISIPSPAGNYEIGSVRIELFGLVSLINDLRIYGAFYRNDCPPTFATGLVSSDNVQNPEQAVLLDGTSFALINIPLGLLNVGRLTLSLPTETDLGLFYGFEVAPNNTLLNLNLLKETEIRLRDANGTLLQSSDDANTLDLVLLDPEDERYIIGYRSQEGPGKVAQIEIAVSGLLELLVDLRVYNGFVELSSGGTVEIVSSSERICNGDQATLTASPGFDNYTWSNGATTQSINVSNPGTYSVIADNGVSSCEAFGSITIDGANLSLSFTASNPSCGEANGTIISDVTSNSNNISYLWSNGATTPNISGLTEGEYSLTVTDNETGCSTSGSVVLENVEGPKVDAVATSSSCTQADGSLILTVEGNAPFSFEWNDGSMEQNRTDIPNGEYMVTVTDINGCSSMRNFVIEGFGDFGLQYSFENPDCGDMNGSIEVLPDSAGSFFYEWSNGSELNPLLNVGPGTYGLTVTELVTNCKQITAVNLDGVNGSDILSATIKDPACSGEANGSITVSLAMSEDSYQINWSNGIEGTRTIEGLEAGMYTVIVLDTMSRCISSRTYTLKDFDPVVLAADVVNTNCDFTNPTGRIAMQIQGGVSPYSYEWSNGATTSSISMLSSGTYAVTVTDSAGCVKSNSYSIRRLDENGAACPEPSGNTEIITPNGDGANDEFVFNGIDEFSSNEFRVFDRWGNIVFEKVEWGGIWKGERTRGGSDIGGIVPDGTYYYKLVLVPSAGMEEITRNGILVVRR